MSTTIFDQVAQAFQNYDHILTPLAALAAPGGIWFWVDKYRNRIRVKVRNFRLARGDQSGRGIEFEFELENIGSLTTSFEPTFALAAYSPKGERQTLTFKVEGNDRRLLAHELKPVRGWHGDPEAGVVAFAWYMTLTVPLTRGGNVRVRVRNVQFEQLGWFRFQWERLRFKVLGRVPQ